MESRGDVLIRWRGVAESSRSSGEGVARLTLTSEVVGSCCSSRSRYGGGLPAGTSVNEADAEDRAESAWQRAQLPVEIRELVLEDQRRRNAIWVTLRLPKRARS
jgi:hypothetical protein